MYRRRLKRKGGGRRGQRGEGFGRQSLNAVPFRLFRRHGFGGESGRERIPKQRIKEGAVVRPYRQVTGRMGESRWFPVPAATDAIPPGTAVPWKLFVPRPHDNGSLPGQTPEPRLVCRFCSGAGDVGHGGGAGRIVRLLIHFLTSTGSKRASASTGSGSACQA